MWTRSSGQISDNVFQLTTAFSTHALFIGADASALVDTSVAAAATRLEAELRGVLTDFAELKFVLLSHAHFDHLGGLLALRRLNPELELIAAPATAELLKDAAVLSETLARNQAVAQASGVDWNCSAEEWAAALKVQHLVGDGDKIDLGGGAEVTVIATPGHTSDSTTFFLRPDDFVAGGEALGNYRGRDKYDAAFSSDLPDYQKSLEKLASLNVRGLILPHGGALTGDLARGYFVAAAGETERFAEHVRAHLALGQTIDEIFDTMILDWVNDNITPDGPFVEAQQNTLRRMIELSVR